MLLVRPVRQHDPRTRGSIRDEDCSQPGWYCLLLPSEPPLGPSGPQVPLELGCLHHWSPSLTAGAQLFWGTAASSTTYSIPSDADTWLRAQPLASNALAQAKGHQMMASADVLFVSYGEEYLFCFPSSKGRWGAWQAELHLTQPKCPCPHILSPTLSVPMPKPLAAWKPPFSKAMSPAAIQASCPEGAHCSSNRPLCSFLAMAPPSVFCWLFKHLQALGPGFLHPSPLPLQSNCDLCHGLKGEDQAADSTSPANRQQPEAAWG